MTTQNITVKGFETDEMRTMTVVANPHEARGPHEVRNESGVVIGDIVQVPALLGPSGFDWKIHNHETDLRAYINGDIKSAVRCLIF